MIPCEGEPDHKFNTWESLPCNHFPLHGTPSASMKPSPSQSTAIDLLKALASQAIVAHHLAGYGPTSLALKQHFPFLAWWLTEYAGMAVQIFLVIAGFLAAQAVVTRQSEFRVFPWRPILARYRRLVIPYAVALLIALFTAMLARPWFDAEFIPDAPRPIELLSHLTLTHVALSHPALSAGVWYVAIDLQLFTMFAMLAWIGSGSARGRQGIGHDTACAGHPWLMVAALGALSLLVFNRNPDLDGWAIYFFGSYAMGALVFWAQSTRATRRWLLAMALVGCLALLIDFRWRPALALLTALTLALAGSRPPGIVAANGGAPLLRPTGLMHYLAEISYALFLVHFPVMMAVSTGFAALELSSPESGLAAAALTWLLSLAAADLLHRQIELRFAAPRRRAA